MAATRRPVVRLRREVKGEGVGGGMGEEEMDVKRKYIMLDVTKKMTKRKK